MNNFIPFFLTCAAFVVVFLLFIPKGQPHDPEEERREMWRNRRDLY